MKNFVLLGIFILSSLGSISQAGDYEITPMDCTQKGRTEVAICTIPEVSDQDTVMARLYYNIQDEISEKCIKPDLCEKLKKQLKKAQWDWIKYRTSFCELEVAYSAEDKVESDTNFGACLIAETKRKIEELRVQRLNFRNIYYKE